MCGGSISLGRSSEGGRWRDVFIRVAAVHSQGGGKQNVGRDLGKTWVLCDFSPC